MLREDLQKALKESMLAHDVATTGAVRLIIAGMKEKDVFKAVTINATKAVDKEEWFGLRVGAKATLSVMEWGDTQIDIFDRAGNSLTSKKGYLCRMTVKNGQILYRNEI